MSKPNRVDVSPAQWAKVNALFDRMLASQHPETLARSEADPTISGAALRLWSNAQRAKARDFLGEPVTLVPSVAADDEPQFVTGQVLADRFTIRSLLGRGGMGEVYLADDRTLREQVAIKTIRGSLASDLAIRNRFLTEVRTARLVSHPNVCRINEIFDQGDTPFLSMQYLDGPRLSELLDAGTMNRRTARRIAIQLAEGLAAAHRSGVVHCDFKPANVILTGSDAARKAMITDFGLARALFPDPQSGDHVLLGASMRGGTVHYMAPELLEGQSPSIRTDVYAYGKLLGELLPGNRQAARCVADLAARRPADLTGVIESLKGATTRRNLVVAGCSTAIAGGSAYLWKASAPVVLAGQRRIAVNGFHANGSERAAMLHQLIITALRQSPLLTVIDEARLRRAAKTDPESKQEPDRASLLAAAGRLNALLVEGTVEQAKGLLKLAIEVFQPATTNALLRFEEQVDDRGAVKLADAMAMRLRREIGESAASRKSEYTPLERVTSTSPEAVDHYFRSMDEQSAGHSEAAIALLDRALKIDPEFALAHLQMGVVLASHDRVPAAMPQYERAFQLRSRLSERERLWIEGRYYNIVQDFESSQLICLKLVTLFPEDEVFQRNMGFALARVGKAVAALPYNQNAVNLNPSSINRGELVANLASANRFDDALKRSQDFRGEREDGGNLDWAEGIAHLGKDDPQSALRVYEHMQQDPEHDRWARLLRCGAWIFQGRLAEASSTLLADMAFDLANGEETRVLRRRSWVGLAEWLLDSPSHAREQADEILKLEGDPATFIVLRELLILTQALGDPDISQRIFERLSSIEKRWPSGNSKAARRVAEALLPQTPAEKAGTLLNEARGLKADGLTHFVLAEWQYQQKDFAGALATYQAVEEQRGSIYHLSYFPGLVILGRIQRARCLSGLSRFDEAARLYQWVLTSWGATARQTGIMRAVAAESRNLGTH